ncbi:pectate lyase [Actinomycetes bacterium KLBMP 9797]
MRKRGALLATAVVGVVGIMGAVGTLAFAGEPFSTDFSDGSGGWSKSGGSWTVAADGANQVFRQSKLASEAARVFAGEKSWTAYAVQARVKPTGFGQAAGFTGIGARAQSATSLYRLVLTGAGTVQLQALKSGALQVLSSAPLPVTHGAWYTLKLEVSGATVRGSVDGKALVSGSSPLFASGQIGLTTGYATADFDDVAVSEIGALPAASPTTPAPTTPTVPPPATPPPAVAAKWPTATGEERADAPIEVPRTGLDGGLKRYSGVGDGGQGEGQEPIFELADGAVLSNVIIGAPAGDGVHCLGSCTLTNVWWEDVGEDAATFKGGASARYLVDGGGAKSAADKVFQHNGGGTLTVRNFQVADFGKLYRSCGNCSTQLKRHVVLQNITATAPGKALAGINANYGDTARFSGITIVGAKNMVVCEKYEGVTSGEPTKIGSGADGAHCVYATPDISYR